MILVLLVLKGGLWLHYYQDGAQYQESNEKSPECCLIVFSGEGRGHSLFPLYCFLQFSEAAFVLAVEPALQEMILGCTGTGVTRAFVLLSTSLTTE